MTRDIPGLVAHMLIGRLGEVKTPADLLWGAADQLMKPAYAERLLAELPAARLTLLEHCGHIPPLECAPAFVAALDRLLAAPAPAAVAWVAAPVPAGAPARATSPQE
jgi:pimeloyl-ACP methyl ester carboxylesterase